MNAVTGGATCGCSCCYEGQAGGSSTTDNGIANYEGGLKSGCGEIKFIV